MDFDFSPRTKELQAQLQRFMDEHIYPNEARYEAEIEDSSLGLDQAVVFGGLDSSSSTEQAGSAQDVGIDLAEEGKGNGSVRCC